MKTTKTKKKEQKKPKPGKDWRSDLLLDEEEEDAFFDDLEKIRKDDVGDGQKHGEGSMTFVSDILVWDEELDDQVHIGSIKTDGKKITLVFPKNAAEDDKEVLRRMAREEINGTDGNLLSPKKDPELFVKLLAANYRNVYLSATVARKEK